MLLSVISPLIHIKGHGGRAPRWLEVTSNYLLEELEHARPFRETVVSRLADILVVQAFRADLNEQANRVKSGWLGALRDRRIGRR